MIEALTHACIMEHDYFAKRPTDTALTTFWVALTSTFCSDMA